MNSVDQRIFELIAQLKDEGKIRFDADFCREIGISKQHLQQIKSNNRHFTIEHLITICKKYKVDANVLLGLNSKKIKKFKTLI